MKNKIKNYLLIYSIFAPVVGCFLPIYAFALCMISSFLIMIINYSQFIKVIKYNYNYLAYIFIVYSIVLGFINHNDLGIMAGFLSFVVIVYLTSMRYLITVKYYEIIGYIIGIGSIFSYLYAKFSDSFTTSNLLINYFSLILKTPYNQGGTDGSRACSTFFNSNYYGYVIIIMIVFALYQILINLKFKKSNLLKLLFYFVVFMINILAIDLPQSRSMYLALLIGIIVLFITFSKKSFLLLAIPSFSLGLIFYQKVLDLVPRFSKAVLDINDRLNLWHTAILEIKNNPYFGKGFYTYQISFSKYNDYYQIHAHNLFLEMVLSFGLIGTMIIICFFIFVLAKPCIIWIKYGAKEISLVLAVLMLTLVHGFTDMILLLPQTFIIFGLIMLAADVSLKKEYKHENS